MTLLHALAVVGTNAFFLLLALMPFMAGAYIVDEEVEPGIFKALFVMAGLFAQVYWCSKGWPQ